MFEFAIAVGAGIAASSIALIAFGADSLIEALAGFVILWRFAASRAKSEGASALHNGVHRLEGPGPRGLDFFSLSGAPRVA